MFYSLALTGKLHRRIQPGALGFLLLITAASAGSAEPAAYKEVSPGVWYAHISKTQGPESIHVVRFDYHRPDLKLVGTLGRRSIFGLASVRKEVTALPPAAGKPIAAINGDFFIMKRDPYQGDPHGLQIIGEQLISSPSKDACFWVDRAGQPHTGVVRSDCKVIWPDGKESPIRINEQRRPDGVALLTPTLGHSTRTTNGLDLVLEPQGPGPWLPLRPEQTYLARVREVRPNGNAPIGPNDMVLSLGPKLNPQDLAAAPGARVKIVTAFTPNLTGVPTAIGGGPLLVAKGQPVRRRSADPRNPRTAIGWNERDFYFVVVDGRKKDLSIGLGFADLAALMIEVGCKEALNLDGGGSTTLWLNGNVVNHPSDQGTERSVANALVLVRKN